MIFLKSLNLLKSSIGLVEMPKCYLVFHCSSVKAISDVYGYVPLGLVTCTHLGLLPLPCPPPLLFTCAELL